MMLLFAPLSTFFKGHQSQQKALAYESKLKIPTPTRPPCDKVILLHGDDHRYHFAWIHDRVAKRHIVSLPWTCFISPLPDPPPCSAEQLPSVDALSATIDCTGHPIIFSLWVLCVEIMESRQCPQDSHQNATTDREKLNYSIGNIRPVSRGCPHQCQ